MKNFFNISAKNLLVQVSTMLICIQIQAQVLISGKVLNETGSGIPNIHLLVYRPGYTNIVAFAISRSDGSFSLTVKVESDSLLLKTSSIQYHNETYLFSNKTQELKIVLMPEIKQLEGVTVKTAPIEKYGDTLSYLVQSFAQKNDRSVEDVLRRMPGITVESNGKILYQDIPINKLYVEGMDITSGNYGIVSKNLPQSSISAVEVFENHQPIRILQDVQFSSQAALNLKLKKKVAATGSVKAGIGASPFLWQLNCTPFVFTKKNQWIISLQADNTGEEILQQIINFYGYGDLNNETEPTEYVNVAISKRPEISVNRYLDNRSFLFNLNSLHYISPYLQLKVNVSLSNDNIHSVSSETKILFTPTDSIGTFTAFNNFSIGQNLTTKLILNRNAKDNYLNDEFVFEARNPEITGEANYAPLLIMQNTKRPSCRLSNSLRSIKPIGSKLLKLNSSILYLANEQNLNISPVLFSDSVFITNSIDSLSQKVKYSRIFTSNYAAMGFTLRKIKVDQELGFTYKNNLLNTDLIMYTSDQAEFSHSDYINDVTTSRFAPYLSTQFRLKEVHYTISLTGKLSNAIITRTDNHNNIEQNASFFLNEENLSFTYKPGSFWQMRLSAMHNSFPDETDRYYPGFILNNYRELSRNENPLSLINNYSFNSNISYRNQITSFFNTLNYTLAVSEYPYSDSRFVSHNGSSVDEVNSSSPGHSIWHSITGYSSKYIIRLRTTVSVKAMFNLVQGTSELNGEKINSSNEVFIFSPSLTINIAKWFNIDYSNTATWLGMYLNGVSNNKLFIYKQNMSLWVFPFKNQSLNFNTEYYYYDDKDHFFADAGYQYSFKKPKIDFQLKARNIFNATSYTSIGANGYYSWVSNYRLRPFEIILSVRFTF